MSPLDHPEVADAVRRAVASDVFGRRLSWLPSSRRALQSELGHQWSIERLHDWSSDAITWMKWWICNEAAQRVVPFYFGPRTSRASGQAHPPHPRSSQDGEEEEETDDGSHAGSDAGVSDDEDDETIRRDMSLWASGMLFLLQAGMIRLVCFTARRRL
jgi:hypothetical protein